MSQSRRNLQKRTMNERTLCRNGLRKTINDCPPSRLSTDHRTFPHAIRPKKKAKASEQIKLTHPVVPPLPRPIDRPLSHRAAKRRSPHTIGKPLSHTIEQRPSYTIESCLLYPNSYQPRNRFNETGSKMDTRLPYRVGSRTLPVLPVKSQFMPNDVPRTQLRAIMNMASAAGIDLATVGDMSANYRYRAGTRPSDGNATFLIAANFENNTEIWKELVVEIQALLGDSLVVEIIDNKVERGLRSFPIRSNETLHIADWEAFLPVIIEKLDEANHEWMTIDFLHRELPGTTGMRQPTIVISARDADDSTWWDVTLPWIRDTLPTTLGVELRYLDSIIATEGVSAEVQAPNVLSNEPDLKAVPAPAHLTAYTEIIPMGTSCGVLNSNGHGTMGGHIELKYESGPPLKLGITNHHVLCRDKLDRHSESGASLSPLNIPRKNKLRVSVPAKVNHEAALEHIHDKIDELPASSAGLELFEADHLRHRLKLQKDLDLYFGTVHATSGRHGIPHQRMKKDPQTGSMEDVTEKDIRKWSALNDMMWHPKIQDSRQADRNTHNPQIQDSSQAGRQHPLPESQELTREWVVDWCLVKPTETNRKINIDLPRTKVGMALSRGDKANIYQRIEPYRCYAVAKCGAQTGWTVGVVNAVTSAIAKRAMLPESKSVTLKHNIIKEVTEERGPLASTEPSGLKGAMFAHNIVANTATYDFLLPGDTGSLVLLDSSTVKGKAPIVGLAFAENWRIGSSYMMPMDLVVKDIEAVTGATVTMPAYAGIAKPMHVS